MTEVLKVVGQTKLSTSFLVKSYFLKSPGLSLFTLYLFNVFVFGYIVYSLERIDGTCMLYRDVTWIIVVSLTNLGFGDYVPTHWLSRSIVAALSVFGIFQTALIVGVLSEALVIPVDEKRLLGIMEKMRLDKIYRHAAARLIQSAWKMYNFRRLTKLDIYTRSQALSIRNFKKRFNDKYKQYTKERELTIKYADSLWQWRQVKSETEHVDSAIEREFMFDETALATKDITNKLNNLERIVKKSNEAPVVSHVDAHLALKQHPLSDKSSMEAKSSGDESLAKKRWGKLRVVGLMAKKVKQGTVKVRCLFLR